MGGADRVGRQGGKWQATKRHNRVPTSSLGGGKWQAAKRHTLGADGLWQAAMRHTLGADGLRQAAMRHTMVKQINTSSFTTICKNNSYYNVRFG